MVSRYFALLVSLLVLVFTFTLTAAAGDIALPAGTLLKCTMNEPNFSSKTAAIGDPVLCRLHGEVEFGEQAFPRGSYLVGHLEDAKDPGHFFGKGYLKIQFDRIGLPTGDLPLETKLIATNGYKVDKEGRIDGKGHVKRDIVEWMLPPLWPWKVIMLPARGPRPTLKGESILTLRLMDDVDIPQVAQTFGPGWHFFGGYEHGGYQRDSFQNSGYEGSGAQMQLTVSQVSAADAASQPVSQPVPQPTYASLVTREIALPANMVTIPGMPVFVLTNGAVLSVSGYGYQDNRISYTLASGGTGVVSADDVDWMTTTRLNAQRGVRVTLHMGHVNPAAPGM
jgi:hypothetical protein